MALLLIGVSRGSVVPLPLLPFASLLHHLLEKVLQDCGNDIDSAIRSLNQLRLGAPPPPSLDSTPIASDTAPPQLQGESVKLLKL